MAAPVPSEPITLGAVLQLLASAVADELQRRGIVRTADRWADAKENPLGSARAFLDAGRRGDFPTFRRGRETVARWEDVEAYIASRPKRARPGAGRVPRAGGAPGRTLAPPAVSSVAGEAGERAEMVRQLRAAGAIGPRG